MLTCTDCKRYVRPRELECPFCGVTLRASTAPGPKLLGAMALVAGLAFAGCTNIEAEEGGSTGTEETSDDSGQNSSTTGAMSDSAEDTDPSSGETYAGPPEDGAWETSSEETGAETGSEGTGTETETGFEDTGTDTGSDTGFEDTETDTSRETG